MDGLFRRGGVWYARIVVPHQLRHVIGKTELVASTGVREPALARVVAAELLAGWRRRLLDLTRTLGGPLDIERIKLGHPALSGGGYLELAEAASASGINESYLLGKAADGELRLYFRCASVPGHLCAEGEFDRDIGLDGITRLVPQPSQMSELVVPTDYSGVLRLVDASASAATLMRGGTLAAVLFELPQERGRFFVPLRSVAVCKRDVELVATDVDQIRRAMALTVTPEQLTAVQQSKTPTGPAPHLKSKIPLSQVVDEYMLFRQLQCNEDQARRIRGALELLVELEGDPPLGTMDGERLAAFRDVRLSVVPAEENKIRLRHGTKSVTESIRAVAGTTWPKISAEGQVLRLKWIAGMFAWAVRKRWIDHDPSALLVKESPAASAAKVAASRNRDQDARDLFTREDLRAIFSAGIWFSTGRGELTAAGTYREFSPHYYWLPLLGLYTGARINELAQLSLTDIKQTQAGTWFIDLALLDDESQKKKRKNPNSRRAVPIHDHLIDLGIVKWKAALETAGYERLFQELSYDKTKGYGKGPTKWFSSYLKGLGWPRDNRKVFHSFRSTLVSECVQRLKLTVMETSQITGHSRGPAAAVHGYIKDQSVDDLRHTVNRLNFELPAISPLDIEQGVAAVKDALGRKKRGRGTPAGD